MSETRVAQAFIISLNEQLANSIHGDLYRQHKESPFWTCSIVKKENGRPSDIDVRSMKQIIEEWILAFLKPQVE